MRSHLFAAALAASLVGLAIDVRTSAPSLKVKTVQPEKPVRTKKAKAA